MALLLRDRQKYQAGSNLVPHLSILVQVVGAEIIISHEVGNASVVFEEILEAASHLEVQAHHYVPRVALEIHELIDGGVRLDPPRDVEVVGRFATVVEFKLVMLKRNLL